MSEYVEGQGFDIPEDLAILSDKRSREGKPLSLRPAKIVAYNEEGIIIGEMPLPNNPKKPIFNIKFDIFNFVDI